MHKCDAPHLNTCRDMPHSYVWHASFICVTCLIHTCDMPHSYVWHASFIYVTWLIHMCDAPHLNTCRDMPHLYVWQNSHMKESFVSHTRDTTRSCTWHTSFIYMSRRASFLVWHDSHMNESCVNPKRDMTHFYTRHTAYADRVAQYLEIIFKNFRFSTRRTRILMRFIIYYLVLIVNPMGRMLIRWKRF